MQREEPNTMSESLDNKKLAHFAVHYQHPAKDHERRCAMCEHFIHGTPPRCEHVKDPIRYGDSCDNFENRIKKSGMRG